MRRLALLIDFVILGHVWLIYSFIYLILNPLVQTPKAFIIYSYYHYLVFISAGVSRKFEFCDLKISDIGT